MEIQAQAPRTKPVLTRLQCYLWCIRILFFSLCFSFFPSQHCTLVCPALHFLTTGRLGLLGFLSFHRTDFGGVWRKQGFTTPHSPIQIRKIPHDIGRRAQVKRMRAVKFVDLQSEVLHPPPGEQQEKNVTQPVLLEGDRDGFAGSSHLRSKTGCWA